MTTTNPFRGIGRPKPTLAWIRKALVGSGRMGEFEMDHSSLTPDGRRDRLDVIRDWFPIAFETRAGRPPTEEELSTYGDGLLVREGQATASDAPPPFEVKRWQTYVPCRPPSYAYPGKPFVVEAVFGDKVEVWDPTGGQRMGGSRWVALRNLHATNKTQTGKERLTGWYLHCEPPTDPVKQELCGSCFIWKDREEFGVLAWGFGHSTCKPCKDEIEERYGKITS